MSAGDRSNFSGDIELTAPTGGVVRGGVYLIENRVVVARETAAQTLPFKAAVQGPVVVTKDTGAGIDFAVCEEVFADSSSNGVQPTAATGGDTAIGYALEAAGINDTEVLIYLGGVSHILQ